VLTATPRWKVVLTVVRRLEKALPSVVDGGLRAAGALGAVTMGGDRI
jgi:hypothetical protein